MDSVQKKRVDYLLNRCLTQTESVQERAELNFYMSNPEYSKIMDDAILRSFFKEKKMTDMSLEKQEDTFNVIRSIDSTSAQYFKRNYYWTGAVVMILSLIIGLSYYITKKSNTTLKIAKSIEVHNKVEELNPAVQDFSKEVSPAKDGAFLKLADGSEISLENLKAGDEVLNDNLVLHSDSDGSLSLRFNNTNEKKPKISQENYSIITPKGRTYKLTLSDGTRVHLNADSKITFPRIFKSKERRVNFEGEAYFEVAKDKDRQFIVTSGAGKTKQEVRVYGTEFNIAAYLDDKKIETTLVEGSVKIISLLTGAEMFLKPNDLAVLNLEGITNSTIDITSKLAWRSNVFYFADDSIVTVMKEISRWYDVKVLYKGDVPDVRIWAQISRTKKLHELLEILSKSNNLKFKIRGKEVEIMK